MTVGYFGSKGTHLRITRNLNQLLPNGARPFPALSAITGATAVNANALTGLATLRPDQIGSVQ